MPFVWQPKIRNILTKYKSKRYNNHHQPLPPSNCYISYHSKLSKTIQITTKKKKSHPTLNEAAKHEEDEAGLMDREGRRGWLQQAATATAVGNGGTGSVERMEARGPRDAHTPFRRRRIKHHCSIKHHTLDGDWGWEVSDSGRCFLAPDASLLQAAFVVPACGHPFPLDRLSLDPDVRGDWIRFDSIRFDSWNRFGRWLLRKIEDAWPIDDWGWHYRAGMYFFFF